MQRPYCMGSKDREFVTEEVEWMCSTNITDPTTAWRALPVVIAPKLNDSYRTCIDYRKLKAVTNCDTYPRPRMYECIDFLVEAATSSTLDAN